MILDLGLRSVRGTAETEMQRALKWEPPLLPELAPGTVRRWLGAATWIPPETHPLCRHRALDGEERVVTTSRHPPDGHMLEFDLGVVHHFALPGTRCLVAEGQDFELTDEAEETGDERRILGYIEQAPLPMLDVLELRRLPSSGQHVLVAGVDDPLYDVAEPVATLGWVESFPIHPRRAQIHAGPWNVVMLRRHVDRRAWRHLYRVRAPQDETDAVTLGALLTASTAALTPLRLRSDGRLETDLTGPSRPSSDPRIGARWMAAPLSWAGRAPHVWAVRASASRALHMVLARSRRQGPNGAEPTVLGWLRRESAPGFSPLFSATHPVTGDQFVTRSEIEADDLGYRLDGTLGYISDAGADRDRADQPQAILWGRRFGQGRRYVEGPKAE